MTNLECPPDGDRVPVYFAAEDLARAGDGTRVPLYTLAEARRELGRQECAAGGHDLEVVEQGLTREPVALVCTRQCGHRGYRVTPVGDTDPRALLRDVMVDLWHDLAAAYAQSNATPRETSVGCHGLIKRIQDIARHVGPVNPGDLEYEMVLTGLYETVHAEIGLEVSVPDQLLVAAREYVEAGGELRDGRTRGLHSEKRDRRIYFGTDVTGTRYYMATGRGGWLPGDYATPEAAEAAFDVPYEELDRLADLSSEERRRITLDDVNAVMTVLAEADVERVPAPCEQWSREQPHPAHPWHAPVDGPALCPGWPCGVDEPAAEG